jgi:hypothetical protein
MGVGYVDMSWVAMGRILVNQGSIPPHASILNTKNEKNIMPHFVHIF